MSVPVVARKDFEDAIRSKSLWVIVALFALVIAAAAWFFGDVQASSQAVSGDALLVSLLIPTSILLPAIGIMLGYKAIVGERTSGTVKLLLSLPNTRRDAVLGKLLGRAAVVAAAVTLGSIIGGVVFAVFATSFPFVEYLIFLALTIVLGVVFVSIGIGFSASTRSDTIAIIGGIGLVLLFTFLWNLLTSLVTLLLDRFADVGQELLFDVGGVLRVINPTNAYAMVLQDLFSESARSPAVQQLTGFYTETWFAALVLVAWLVVPIALGYWRFERAELG